MIGDNLSVLDVISKIHGSVTGKGEVLPITNLAELCIWLRERRNNWVPSSEEHWEVKEFDDAVKNLATMALREASLVFEVAIRREEI